MIDEDTFLGLLREEPHDGATWLVYADWLEGQGDEVRAAIVRLQRRLGETVDPAERLSCGRELLERSMGLPRVWLSTLASAPIDGTCWGASDDNNGVYLLVFGPAGVLRFKQGTTGDEAESWESGDGTWMQIGNAVVFSIFREKEKRIDYSRQEGVVFGDQMWGIGSDEDGQTWTWTVRPLGIELFDGALPELPAEPKDTPTTSADLRLPQRRWTSSLG